MPAIMYYICKYYDFDNKNKDDKEDPVLSSFSSE